MTRHRYEGGPFGGTFSTGDDSSPLVVYLDADSWRHVYRRDDASWNRDEPDVLVYRHDPTASTPFAREGDIERPAEARERLRRTAREAWPPGGVGPGDVPGGRIRGVSPDET